MVDQGFEEWSRRDRNVLQRPSVALADPEHCRRGLAGVVDRVAPRGLSARVRRNGRLAAGRDVEHHWRARLGRGHEERRRDVSVVRQDDRTVRLEVGDPEIDAGERRDLHLTGTEQLQLAARDRGSHGPEQLQLGDPARLVCRREELAATAAPVSLVRGEIS